MAEGSKRCICTRTEPDHLTETVAACVHILEHATSLISVNYSCQQQLWALRPFSPVPQSRSSQIRWQKKKCSRTGKHWHLQGNQSKITLPWSPKQSRKTISCLLGHLWPSWTSSGWIIKAFRPNQWPAQWWVGQTINLHSQERFRHAHDALMLQR